MVTEDRNQRAASSLHLWLLVALLALLALIITLIKPAMANGIKDDTVLNAISGHNRAELMFVQARMGNNEALLELQRQAYDGVTAYVILLAYHEASQGDYRERDRLIWQQLKHANSLESLILLNYFAYLFDNEALAAVIRNNLEEDGSINHDALMAIREVSFSPEQLNTMRECLTHLTIQFPDQMLAEWSSSSANPAQKHVSGACFQDRLPEGQLNATR